MNHNLDDSLNYQDSMGDFNHSENIEVSQSEIILDDSIEHGVMEFDQFVDKHMEMETEHEEVVAPESVNQQFTLGPEAYTFQDNQPMETVIETTQSTASTSQSQSMPSLDLQAFIANAPTKGTRVFQGSPQYITIKPAPPRPAAPAAQAAALRHVAIAPKPSQMGPGAVPLKRGAVAGNTHTIAATKTVKNVSLTNVINKGQPMLARIGKQLVMIPAGSGQQKLKLLQADGKHIQAQFIQTKSATQKPVMAKVIVQNQQQIENLNLSQSAVLTKISSGAGGPAPRFVTVQQKPMPISLGNNVILATSPSKDTLPKQGHQLVFSPQKKVIARTQGNKKFIIKMNPQESVTKPPTPKKTKNDAESNMHTEIHQINVPGKGIQYIKLVTKPKQPMQKVVLTENKGSYIQMMDGKIISGQSMVFSSSSNAKVTNSQTAGPAKFVRIAPVAAANKATQQVTVQAQARPAQSLLSSSESAAVDPLQLPSEADSKDTLRELVARLGEDLAREDPAEEDPAGEDFARDDAQDADLQTHEVEISFERQSSIAHDESTHSADDFGPAELAELAEPAARHERPRAPRPTRVACEEDYIHDFNINQNSKRDSVLSPPHESEYAETESAPGTEGLELRARKPCNCSKSQCLKLYCDCFANGEFCNNCNCLHCHNNLRHEDLRQKAIRGCLDRNPSAFRPKIGKLKSGGQAVALTIRRHNKGCNCKRSGCLKNYCECYEAKIACSSNCKCVGCRNVEDGLGRARRDAALLAPRAGPAPPAARAAHALLKQPCSFMTSEVIEAVCQCLVAAAAEPSAPPAPPAAPADRDPVASVIEEFARCLQDIISAAQQGPPVLVESSLA